MSWLVFLSILGQIFCIYYTKINEKKNHKFITQLPHKQVQKPSWLDTTKSSILSPRMEKQGLFRPTMQGLCGMTDLSENEEYAFIVYSYNFTVSVWFINTGNSFNCVLSFFRFSTYPRHSGSVLVCNLFGAS